MFELFCKYGHSFSSPKSQSACPQHTVICYQKNETPNKTITSSKKTFTITESFICQNCGGYKNNFSKICKSCYLKSLKSKKQNQDSLRISRLKSRIKGWERKVNEAKKQIAYLEEKTKIVL